MATLAGLRQLPAGLAALVASSPEFFERFRRMTRGEQLQALSKLTTSLIVTGGTATATTRTLSSVARGVEALTVPALSLSARGTLVMERVAVRAVTVLAGGPGAALIVQSVNHAAGNTGTPSQGPGQWGPSHESMSARAARYQEQVTGRPVTDAYWVRGVGRKSGGIKFDDFRNGVLVDAKGPGYANKFADDLTPRQWFRNSGAQELVQQARRQEGVANGISIRWHVAEEKAARAIRKLLKNAGVVGVEVVHTPML